MINVGLVIMGDAIIMGEQSFLRIEGTDYFTTLFLGFGCCLSWINCLTILEGYERFNQVS